MLTFVKHFVLLLLGATMLARGVAAPAAPPTVRPDDLPRIPATPPDKVVGTFVVTKGFRVELMAAEPTVMDPVALAFDEEGALFVVEMGDYSERRDERLGRIKRLVDLDGDGRFDRATLFADKLPWPTGVACWNGGIFVIASPDILFFQDTNGDGMADRQNVVYTGFGNLTTKLNVQALPNSLTWGLDNRIHGALGGNPGIVTNLVRRGDPPVELRGRDFSFDPRSGHFRAEAGGGQYGLAFDDVGRKFVCSNSRHLIQVMYDRDDGFSPFHPLPAPTIDIAVDGPAAEVFRISPDEPWRVLRTKWRVEGIVPGLIEGGGRPSGYFTAATGLAIQRGDGWPKSARGNALVADCGSNLIHRKQLLPSGPGLVGQRPAAEQDREFLASTDNWFRPVQLINAPDGQMWFADLYREIIEHPWSLPDAIKQQLDLNSGNDRGRVYRMVADPGPAGFTRTGAEPIPARQSNLDLVALLDHPNGWHRDTAARLIYQRQDAQLVTPLRDLASRDGASALGRSHALYALHGQSALTLADLDRALGDHDERVRQTALRLAAETTLPLTSEFEARLRGLSADSSAPVRFQLAFTLARRRITPGIPTLADLARRCQGDTWLQDSVLGLTGTATYPLFQELWQTAHTNDPLRIRPMSENFLADLARLIARRGDSNEIARLIAHLAIPPYSSYFLPVAIGMGEGLTIRGLTLARVDPNRRLAGLFAAAGQSSVNPSQTELIKRRSLTLLGLSGNPNYAQFLYPGLNAFQAPTVSKAALDGLLRLNPPNLVSNLLRTWPIMRTEVRRMAVAHLMDRPLGHDLVLRGLERGTMARADFTAVDIAALRGSSDPGVVARTERIFGTTSPRAQIIAGYRTALQLKGDRQRGQQIYQERCASCHRMGQEGFAVGPDLTSVAGNGKAQLLESILDPEREIAPAYAAVNVEARTGESFTGVLVAENDSSVTLRLPNIGDSLLPRQQVVSINRLRTSLMPEGLEAGINRQEMADLLEFIASGARKPPAPPGRQP